VGAVPSPYDFPSNPFATQWQYKFHTTTDQFSVSDTIALAKDLSLGLGFKSLKVSTDGTLEVGTGKPSGNITASKGFLPQLGLNYRLSKTDEVFASAARNMRAFQAAATGATPWATTDVGFAAIKDTLKPETSDNFEAGWRTQGKFYEGTLTAYMVNFHDRLLAVQSQAGIVGNPVVLSNVGGVRSVGMEAALSLRLMPGVTWYNSLSQSNSTYRNDVVGGTTTVATSGKHVVDSPDTMLKSVLGYDDGQLFGNLGLDYMSKRFFTYTNDQSVPSRTLLNIGAGYRMKTLAMLHDASLQLGVTNLANTKYVSTIGSNGFGNSGDNQTLLAGAPRQVFVTFSAKL
jgi:iron complex outermembrane receptor protein